MASIIKQYNGKVIKNAGDCLIYYFPKTVGIINNSSNSRNSYSTNDNSYGNIVDNVNSNDQIIKTSNEKLSSITSAIKTTTPTTSLTKYNKYNNNIKISKESAFENVIECGLAMIQANSTLNENLHGNGLPSISYRISANYGLVELATSTNSNGVDLFGPTVNICSKINHLALPNQMVIHKDLYDIIKESLFFKNYLFKITSESKINDEFCIYTIYSVHRIDNFEWEINNNYKRIKEQVEQNQNKQDLSSTPSFNILLIDDDEDVLFTFEHILGCEGYNLISFSDSIKALDHLSSLDPYYYDLIVTDIRMPVLNGFQLYKQIKVLNPDTKVLFVSALDVLKEIMIVSPDMNSTNIIRKPTDPDSFISKIKSMLCSFL